MKRLSCTVLCVIMAALLLCPSVSAKSGMLLWGNSDPKLIEDIVTYKQGDTIQFTGLTVKKMVDYHCGLVELDAEPTDYLTTELSGIGIAKDAFLYNGTLTPGKVVLDNQYATVTLDTSGVAPGQYRFMAIIITEVMNAYYQCYIYQDIEIVVPDGSSPAAAPEISVTAPPEITLTAAPTPSNVYVDGTLVNFDAYKINNSNYFKLRDLASVLSGTGAKFQIQWDQQATAIRITNGQAYTAEGGEMKGKGSSLKAAKPCEAAIFIDGEAVALSAYEIDGYNYFKLRDVGQAVGFSVEWDSDTNDIHIMTK